MFKKTFLSLWFFVFMGVVVLPSTTWAEEGSLIPVPEIHGFGHVAYEVNNTSGAGWGNNFANGGVDLFITSKISNHFSFMNETVFEFGPQGQNILDVERVMLKVELADWFNVAIGRGHTALGYWNQRFHHGTWLHTTQERPLIYSWEDEGGVLPMHFVGAEFTGTFNLPKGTLSYVSNVANGRCSLVDCVQLVEDADNSKMVSLMLTWEPTSDLGIGGTVLYDRIPADAGLAGRTGRIDEMLFGGHVYYTKNPFEIIIEGKYLKHSDKSVGGTETAHLMGYAQVAYQIKKFKPYYRFDYLNIEAGDAFYTEYDDTGAVVGVLAGVEDTKSHTVGVRYDVATFAALKFEFQRTDAPSADVNRAGVQASFGF